MAVLIPRLRTPRYAPSSRLALVARAIAENQVRTSGVGY
jgi:hypothetical protein